MTAARRAQALGGGGGAPTPLDLVASERIARLRRRYQEEVPRISIQRARLYTESWRATEGRGLPPAVRVAEAMRHVYEHTDQHIDPDDRLVGGWSEHFLGWPIDIERGLFNGVFRVELTRPAMLWHQTRSYARFAWFLLRHRTPREIVRIARAGRSLGPSPINVGLKTLSEREVNPYRIDPAERRELQRNILPYWRGRTAADRVQAALEGSEGLFRGDMQAFQAAVPAVPSQQGTIVSLAAVIATYQGHIVQDFDQVLRRGLAAMLGDVRAEAAKAADHPHRDHEVGERERAFLRSQELALEGMIAWAERLADAVDRARDRAGDPQHRAELERTLAIVRKVPVRPATTFREAIQALWAVRTALEIAHPTNVHSLGRLDQTLWPFYERDLREGRLTREEARELVEELLLKVMTQNMRPESNILGNFYLRYEGSTPVTLSGQLADGRDATNDLTYVVLEAAGRSRSITSVVVRVHGGTPEALLDRVSEILHSGSSNLSLMSDDVFVPALERYGFEADDARNYAITGCTDAVVPGKTGGAGFAGLLLARVLDMALRDGDAMTLAGLVRGVGPRTGEPEELATFDDLLEAFHRQAAEAIRVNVEASRLRDEVFAEHYPAPCISAFIGGCLDERRDVTRGGARYDLSGMNIINSVANVVDSLYVIKRLVYEERRLTLRQIVRAVDADFVGHEALLAAIRQVEGKWGNGCAESDALARQVMTRVFEEVERHRSFRQDAPWASFVNSMTSHTMDGRISAATPDGRRAATPFAASCNPYNVERAGLTGVLRSVAALDMSPVLGCAVNVRLHPSAIGTTPATRRKWTALLRAYFQMGGAQLQPTVASAEMLRAALRDPESHRELIVKVGGYSTYFVGLGREIQDEVISRCQHEAAA